MATSIRYIFWGTPDFAATALAGLIDAGYEPLAVVTATDKIAGRGRKLSVSPVKELALSRKIPVWQPVSLKDPEFVKQVIEASPDFMLVVAFRMLPQSIIEIPHGGTWNLHGSLLPDLRGAAPIHWAIRLGYRRTGLTVFRIQYQIDTGDILESLSLEIPSDWNAGMLHDTMAKEGASLLVKVLPQIAKGTYQLKAQDLFSNSPNQIRNLAPKIQRTDACIDWNREASTLVDFIRAFAPTPGAYTFLDQTRIVILEAIAEESTGITRDFDQDFPKGYCLVHGNNWWIRANQSWLRILQIKPENSKAMEVKAYLRGHADVNHKICSMEL
ncbi:MAG: methionyl-tRNA formyltransferase [Sphingomonadales bacterium]|nr:methionyl-tRNA formyltransferase [Sphingomonadales bacterium]MBM3923245.1 methionyl-tRNA formyltransferase [Sphingomonadales bacterium]MBM3931382.1 methionyl-tRNA formyltransferase [Sphingomonadales bacterium]